VLGRTEAESRVREDDLRNALQGLQYIVDLQKLRFEKIPPEKRRAEDWHKEA